MRNLSIDSQALSGAAYDNEKKELHVTFKRGETRYIFHDVPEAVVQEMESAKSAGSFFMANIYKQFRFTKR